MLHLQIGATSGADLVRGAVRGLRIWCMAGMLVFCGAVTQAAYGYGWDPEPTPVPKWFWAAYFCPSATPVASCSTCLASRLGVTSEVKVDNPSSDKDGPYHYSCYYRDWDGVSWNYANNTVKGPYCPDGTTLSEDRQHCHCPAGKKWFKDVLLCVAVTQLPTASSPPNHPSNNGGSCATDPGGRQPQCGEPINPATGNMWHTERDYAGASAAGDLTIARTYNSSPYNWDEAAIRGFGKRWTHRYDAVLQPELSYQSGTSPATCWRREDKQIIWCETTRVVRLPIPDAVSIVRGDGKKSLFRRSELNWLGDANNNDRLSATYDAGNTAVLEWMLTSAQDDATERYDSSGRLLSITARTGAVQRLTYSDGQSNDTRLGRIPADAPLCQHVPAGAALPAGTLLCVTTSTGQQLQFEYAGNKISKIIDPANQAYLYEYDGPSGGCPVFSQDNPACSAHNLTKVTYPDGNSRTYVYNESSQISGGSGICDVSAYIGNGFGSLANAMTGLVDENGARHISWTYNCSGRATSSQLAGGVEKVTLSYTDYDSSGKAVTDVTHHVGEAGNPVAAASRYASIKVLQRAQNAGVDQPCVECGDAKIRSYDSNGNLFTRTDWNGNKTCFAYDTTRNLEIVRLEGTPEATTCGASLAATTLAPPLRKTSTQWHASYRLPLKIAEPNRITSYSYDSRGNLLARTEQATSDATGMLGMNAPLTGTARTWRYTYNDIGQVLTMRSPRTDIDDTSTYAYDSQSNLATITNAAGHVTTLSHYDANGHVGRIVESDGSTTDLAYTARGWLTAKTAGDDVTTYDYDAAGQLSKVTLADGTRMTYTYDDAHRLTGIADQLGNAIHYTLDLRGNRIKEEVKGLNGSVLARQTLRVIDALNRLQQVTGGAQ